MKIDQLIAKTRTHRKFREQERIAGNTLTGLIDMARLGGSARNGQPWQYAVINDRESCSAIFPYLGWAGYLTDWQGPVDGERPAAYVLCLLNRQWLKGSEKEAHFDLGIATQNLLLGAAELNLQGCRIGAFSPKLANLFTLPEHLTLELVIALGAPAEKVVIEESKTADDIRYWRDNDQVHHVPKRPLKEIVVQLERVLTSSE
jgi:nitroreductase